MLCSDWCRIGEAFTFVYFVYMLVDKHSAPPPCCVLQVVLSSGVSTMVLGQGKVIIHTPVCKYVKYL